MQVHPATGRGPRTTALTLIALERMPCGCVAGVYRANPAIVELELVEAKGPHCRYYGHRSGEVIALCTDGIPGDGGK